MHSKMVLLITTAIYVSADRTQLVDPDERRRHTLFALKKWRDLHIDLPIVVCDGSGYNFQMDADFYSMKNNLTEFISFQNDVSKVKQFGKGWGEGEIISYAIDKSTLISTADWLIKCTGKLWVLNHNKFIVNDKRIGYFDYGGNNDITWIDTRYYVVNINWYKNNLRYVHRNVNDYNGTYLEHCFAGTLKKERYCDFLTITAPMICGVSGSTGVMYIPGRFKHFLRSLRNVFFFV
jgi:hypothetical protein